jgi:hypothetical protein
VRCVAEVFGENAHLLKVIVAALSICSNCITRLTFSLKQSGTFNFMECKVTDEDSSFSEESDIASCKEEAPICRKRELN